MNIAKGACGGNPDYKHTEEALKKISEASKSRIVSDETKRRRSESLKDKPLSEEHKRKLSEARKGKTPWNKGKTHSEDTKKQMSETHKDKTIYHFIHKTGIEFVGTQYELHTTYNLKHRSVCALVKGKNKSLKGWKLKK